MSHAGLAGRNFRGEAAWALASSFFYGLFMVAPVLFVIADVAGHTSSGAISPASALAAGSATLLCFAVLVAVRLPRALRISFAPADSPAHVRVVRWWRVRRIPVSALSGVTVIEYRYRRSRETAAGDAQRETISRLPYRIDAVLHRDRAADGSWTVRGKGGEAWRPDTRDIYGPLAGLLAPAGLTIDRQLIWTQEPVRHSQWFSPGSGGANALGGVLPRARQRRPEHAGDYPRVTATQATANGPPPREPASPNLLDIDRAQVKRSTFAFLNGLRTFRTKNGRTVRSFTRPSGRTLVPSRAKGATM
jgi:hypothetical protein